MARDNSLTAYVPPAPQVPALQEAINLLDVARARELLRPLSPEKRKFLRFRGFYDSDMACAKALGHGQDTAKNWLRRDPAFKAAYEAILVDPVVHATAEMALLAPKAVQRLDELMDDSDGKVAIKAVENVLKAKPIQLLGEMQLKIRDDRPPEENPYIAALMRLQARRGVRPAIEEPASDEDTVDAQWKDVTPKDE